MKTINEIRKDLNDIKYYYSRTKKMMNQALTFGDCDTAELVKEYSQIVRHATPRLFDLYVSLYVNNMTQESAAEYFGYSREYIARLNKKLLLFIQKSTT